jgi:hypothetical protein
MRWAFAAFLLSSTYALAQMVPDPAKLAPVYRAQRDNNADGLAQCAVTNQELTARVAELEKKLEAKNAETPK